MLLKETAFHLFSSCNFWQWCQSNPDTFLWQHAPLTSVCSVVSLQLAALGESLYTRRTVEDSGFLGAGGGAWLVHSFMFLWTLKTTLHYSTFTFPKRLDSVHVSWHQWLCIQMYYFLYSQISCLMVIGRQHGIVTVSFSWMLSGALRINK